MAPAMKRISPLTGSRLLLPLCSTLPVEDGAAVAAGVEGTSEPKAVTSVPPAASVGRRRLVKSMRGLDVDVGVGVGVGVVVVVVVVVVVDVLVSSEVDFEMVVWCFVLVVDVLLVVSGLLDFVLVLVVSFVEVVEGSAVDVVVVSLVVVGFAFVVVFVFVVDADGDSEVSDPGMSYFLAHSSRERPSGQHQVFSCSSAEQ
jgi:hypothetical protein